LKGHFAAEKEKEKGKEERKKDRERTEGMGENHPP